MTLALIHYRPQVVLPLAQFPFPEHQIHGYPIVILRKDNAIVKPPLTLLQRVLDGEPPPTFLQRLLDCDAFGLLQKLAFSLQLHMPQQLKNMAAGSTEGKRQSELIFLPHVNSVGGGVVASVSLLVACKPLSLFILTDN